MSAEKKILQNCKDVFLKRQEIILKSVNIEIITFFWETGIFLRQLDYELRKDVFKEISRIYEKKGNCYTIYLKQMEKFASIYQAKEVQAISPFLSWYHILQLIKVNELRLRNYLTELIIKERLNSSNLKKKIKNIDKENISLEITDRHDSYLKKNGNSLLLKYYSLLQKTVKQNRFNTLDFLNSAIPSFYWSFLNTKKDLSKLPTKDRKRINGITINILEQITNRVASFCERQRRFFNSNVNILCWEVGECLSAGYNIKLTHDQLNTLKKDINKLTKKYIGTFFSDDDTISMIEFHKKVPDFEIALWLSTTLTWHHIRFLLKLDNIKEIIYYALLTIKKCMTPSMLNTVIEQKKMVITAANKRAIEGALKRIMNPKLKRKSENTRSGSLEIMIKEYNFEVAKPKLLEIAFAKKSSFNKLIS